VSSATTKSARQLLDEVLRAAQIEAFAVDRFLERVNAEVGDSAGLGAEQLAARDAQLEEMLSAIDGFTSRVMRIKLDHLLASDNSVAPQFRTYLSSRVLDYDGDLDRLRARVVEVVSRVDPDGAPSIGAAIVDAADEALSLRRCLRQGGMALTPPRSEPEP